MPSCSIWQRSNRKPQYSEPPFLIQEGLFCYCGGLCFGIPPFPLIPRAYSCSFCFHVSCISCFHIRGQGGPPFLTGGPLWRTGKSTFFYREVQRCVTGGPPHLCCYSKSSQGGIPGRHLVRDSKYTGRSTKTLPARSLYGEVHFNRLIGKGPRRLPSIGKDP